MTTIICLEASSYVTDESAAEGEGEGRPAGVRLHSGKVHTGVRDNGVDTNMASMC